MVQGRVILKILFLSKIWTYCSSFFHDFQMGGARMLGLVLLVACNDSISHYVCPSVGPSVTHLLFSFFDHAWGPQSHCLGKSSCFWSHWSQFQMNSLRNFKKSKNFQKFKIQKSEVLGQRMCSKWLSMLSQHWSFILAPFIFSVACSDSISHHICQSVSLLVSQSLTHFLFSFFDHARGPQSQCLDKSSCLWSHWCQKFKIKIKEVLALFRDRTL